MELYLIRHGIAAEPQEYHSDLERPLTAKGQQKTQEVAQKLLKTDLKFELILTSPLTRAYQTAEILQNAGLSKNILQFPALSPGGDLQTWLTWWLESGYNKPESCLALVGHQPDLGNWAEILVWGKPQDKLILKKAGVIGLKLPENLSPVGNSELFLLTSPKWLL